MSDEISTSRGLIRTDVAELEADVAYFDARLTLIGRCPDTAYRRAQIKTYETLSQSLAATLHALKKKQGRQRKRR